MALNLASIIDISAAAHGAEPAQLACGRRHSYAELRDAVHRFAGVLTGLGIRPGDRVAMMLPNIPEFTVVYFGILCAGAVVVPINILAVAGEVAYFLQHSEATALVAWEGFWDAASVGREAAASCRDLVMITRPGTAIPAGALDFRHLMANATPLADSAATMPDDTAVILYTSGTTGRPKGAELTHFNLYSNAQWCAERSHSAPPDRYVTLGPGHVSLAALPLYHSFGQTCVQNAMLFNGAAISYLPRFTADDALEAIARDRVTYFAGVPTMYFALLHHPGAGERDLSSLRYCTSGGAPMPVEVMNAFDARFGTFICEGYGLSETSPVATFHTPVRPRKPGTVGWPILGVEVRIFDDTDQPVPAGTPGEVVIRGQNIMKGYFRDPVATAEAMRSGWFHTGDVGVMDEDGYLAIVDRKKDMILRGGYNVYPREVEETLYSHPAVREAAVIGVPNAEHGEEVRAVIALKEGTAATEAEIIAFCKKRMAAYKYPRSVLFRDALPKTPTGKILKRALRDEVGSKT
jgi:long-chain acyl-CoA synthetase